MTPVIVETSAEVHEKGRDRRLVLEVRAGYLYYRPKGLKRGYMVPHGAAYMLGAKIAAGFKG